MYTRELIVLPSDSSCQGTIKLRSLLDYFQDTAELAVQSIEGTAVELAARGYAWVLTRYEIEITGRLPMLDERFFIHTFHDPSHGYSTLRVFQVDSSNGQPLVWAKTSWLLLDLAAGRPVKPASRLPEILTRDTESIDSSFREIPELRDEQECIHSSERRVKFHELDYNSHVNNAVYFEWVFDESPVDYITHELKTICASFRSGAKFGEHVMIRVARIPSVAANGDESPEDEPMPRIVTPGGGTVTRIIRPEYNDTLVYRISRENVKKPCASFLCVWKPKKEE